MPLEQKKKLEDENIAFFHRINHLYKNEPNQLLVLFILILTSCSTKDELSITDEKKLFYVIKETLDYEIFDGNLTALTAVRFSNKKAILGNSLV